MKVSKNNMKGEHVQKITRYEKTKVKLRETKKIKQTRD